MIALKFLAGLLLLIVLVIFSLQNMEPQVEIRYYFGKSLGPMPFSFAILAAAVVGSVVAALVTLIEQIKLRNEIRKQARRIRQQEEELLEYRRQPPEPLAEEGSEEEEVPALLSPKPQE